jgi:hypothetical protein
MSKLYQVFCDACGCDYSVEIQNENHVPKHCTACGTELDDSSVIEESEEFDADNWDTDEILRDIDDWK